MFRRRRFVAGWVPGVAFTCVALALAATLGELGCTSPDNPDVTDGSSLDHTALDAADDTATDAAVESCSGDAAPGLVTLVSGQSAQYPRNLVVKATGVYWTTLTADAGSTVMSVPLGGGTPTTIVTVPGAVQDLAVDATHAYWTEVSAPDGRAAPLPNSVVKSVPLGGGMPITIASGQANAGNLAVDSTSVYWITGDATSGSVMKAPLGGGTPTTLASDQPAFLIAVDNSNVYWTIRGANQYAPFSVMTVPLQGGVAKYLTAETSFIYGLAVDTANVYWAVYGSGFGNTPRGAVNKMPSGGGTLTVVALGDDITGLAVDGLNVYWTSVFGDVNRAPVSGGTPVTVYSQGAISLAVDCTSLYFATWDIVRLSPK